MLLIFDCDGVVLDSMLLHTEVEAAAYAALGIAITAPELARRFAGVSQAEISQTLEREFGRPVPADFDGLVRDRKEAVFAARLKPVPHIETALEALDGMPRCIASGAGTATLRHGLEVTGLHRRFAPHIFSSDLVARGKPAPDLFLLAARELGVPPAACVVIEDGVAGVRAGRAAGMRVLGFIGGSHCDEGHAARLAAEGALAVFSDMRTLPDLVAGLGAASVPVHA